MLRWLRKKLLFCLLLLMLLYYIRSTRPAWLQTLGRWVQGEGTDRLSVAVGGLLDSLQEGQGMGKAVEVFREGLQD